MTRTRTSLVQLSKWVAASAVVAFAAGTGCDSKDTTTAPISTGTGGGGTGGAGQGAGSTGPGAGNSNAHCGNDMKEAGEQCDGPAFGNVDCTQLGFSGGVLKCTASCRYDESGCTGHENCEDGLDNDGDAKIDCADSDCADACAHACTKLPTLPDDDTVFIGGLTTGHAVGPKPSCASAISGPETAYSFVAAHTGFLVATVGITGNANLTLSVRKTCSDATSELACDSENTGTASTLLVQSVPVTKGDALTIAVDGFGKSDAGGYTIYAATHPLACGDGHVDPPEECDDGNTDGGDGCSSTCKLESSEHEPNDTRAQANAFSSPWTAEIEPMGDVDCVSIQATADGQKLVAETDDLGDGACANGTQDSYVSIYDASGTLLADDDDGGDHLCARAETGMELTDGASYFVCVKAGLGSPNATFPYHLILTLM